jgi:hypothetical protein
MDGVCLRQQSSRTKGIRYEISSDFLHSVVFEMKSVRTEGTVQHNIYQHFVAQWPATGLTVT